MRLVTDNDIGHSVTCDLSEASGGTNVGPTPLELALKALAGCGVIYADVCKNSRIDPGNINISVEVEKAANSPTLSGVSMKVNIASKARKALVEAAWRRTEQVALCCLFSRSLCRSKLKLKSKLQSNCYLP